MPNPLEIISKYRMAAHEEGRRRKKESEEQAYQEALLKLRKDQLKFEESQFKFQQLESQLKPLREAGYEATPKEAGQPLVPEDLQSIYQNILGQIGVQPEGFSTLAGTSVAKRPIPTTALTPLQQAQVGTEKLQQEKLRADIEYQRTKIKEIKNTFGIPDAAATAIFKEYQETYAGNPEAPTIEEFAQGWLQIKGIQPGQKFGASEDIQQLKNILQQMAEEKAQKQKQLDRLRGQE